MKTSIKILAFVVAAATFTACSAPTIDPVTRPATSIIQPITPSQPQPIAETLDDEQPTTGRPTKIALELPAQIDQQPQPTTVDNPVPQPMPRPAYQKPSHN